MSIKDLIQKDKSESQTGTEALLFTLKRKKGKKKDLFKSDTRVHNSDCYIGQDVLFCWLFIGLNQATPCDTTEAQTMTSSCQEGFERWSYHSNMNH